MKRMLSFSFNNMKYITIRRPFLYKTFNRYFSLNSMTTNINQSKESHIKQLFSGQNIDQKNNLNTQIDNSIFSLNISNSALEKLKQIKLNRKKPDIYLRITVEGGGCSGFVYNLSLENDKSKINNKDDLLFNHDNELVVIDKTSISFLEGSTIEFVDSMIKAGFYIKENPTAEQSCSCGTSFTPNFDKLEKKK